MKVSRIANAVGYLDDDLVSCADGGRKRSKAVRWKWGALAACFAVVLIAVVAVLPSLLGGNVAAGSDSAGPTRKDVTVSELAILWPWDYRTVYERYGSIEVNGVVYEGQMREIGASLLGDCLGSYEGWGYEDVGPHGQKEHRETFAVYAIRGVTSSDRIAAEMEGKYYVFRRGAYLPPADLGELMASVALPEVLELKGFSKNGDGADAQHFFLEEDAYIWEVLSDCSDAKFVAEDDRTEDGRERISFGVTSEALGIYKKVFTITEDGYLFTNAFEWGYAFEIGEEAAGKILRYAATHSSETEFAPYRPIVAGRVTEITDGYLVVDDAALCGDPADGRQYRVPLEDLRIRRYVACGVIEIGDTVAVEYEGEIDPTAGDLVQGAVCISRAKITDGDVMIPE